MKNAYDYLNDVRMDFDIYDEEPITEEEVYKMSKISKTEKKGLKKKALIIGAAAVFAVATGVMAADGNIGGIIKTITLGNNIFVQTDPEAAHPLPEELYGRLYDKQGNIVTAVTEDGLDSLYDENGKHIDSDRLMEIFEDALGDEADFYEEDEADKVTWSSLEEAQAAADFDIKQPGYMPEGFAFESAHAYKDKEGSLSGLYVNLDYSDGNGNVITVMERLLNEETAFKISTDGEMEEVLINGINAVILNGRNINFETQDNISVSIHGGNIARDELIKIAESIV